MARNRMTIEKHQRDAKKRRKAEEKREAKRLKKMQGVPSPSAVPGAHIVDTQDSLANRRTEVQRIQEIVGRFNGNLSAHKTSC